MTRRRNRSWLLALTIVTALVVAACGDDGSTATTAPQGAEPAPTSTTDAEPAPEFAAIDGWHNTEPLTLAGMQGSTVLLVFFSDT